jgi:hypothetical protein
MDELELLVAGGDKITFTIPNYRTRSASKIVHIERGINIKLDEILSGLDQPFTTCLALGEHAATKFK